MERVITKHAGVKGIADISVAMQHGAYLSLKRLRKLSPREVIEIVSESGLRGRGGAGFPVGRKWSMVERDPEAPAYLIVNADESEPGTFKDRVVIESDPHLVVEGMFIAARAVGARRAFAYFRGEYIKPMDSFRRAVLDARDAGFIGEGGVVEDVTIYRGAGPYVCGEETALIRSIEGRRGLPEIKPPYPVEEGLFGRPTVVQNVETLAALPFIVREGPEAFARLGTERSSGTKLVSISGAVNEPGVYEVEMGTPVSNVLREEAGGMPEGMRLKALLPGGISTAVLTAGEALSCAVDFESLSEAGSALGSGGMIVIDDATSMVSVLASIARFFAGESCGKCTPCREGSGWISKILSRMESGLGRRSDVELMCDLAHGMRETALCPLAESLAIPVLSFTAKFRDEFEEAVN